MDTAKRKETIGASEGAAVLGLSPWKSPIDVWRYKTGRQTNDAANSEAAHWGLRLEPIVAQEYADRNNVTLSDSQGRYKRGVLSATIDYRIDDDTLLEIKTTSAWMPTWQDVPTYYRVQAYHQMICTDATKVVFALLAGGNKYEEHIVTRPDSEYLTVYERALTLWWQRHIVADKPPEPINIEDMYKLFPRAAKDTSAIATREMVMEIDEYRTLLNQVKGCESRMDDIKKGIMKIMGDSETLVNEYGDVLATWRTQQRKGTINAEIIKAVHNLTEDDLDRLRNPPSESRVWRVR